MYLRNNATFARNAFSIGLHIRETSTLSGFISNHRRFAPKCSLNNSNLSIRSIKSRRCSNLISRKELTKSNVVRILMPVFTEPPVRQLVCVMEIMQTSSRMNCSSSMQSTDYSEASTSSESRSLNTYWLRERKVTRKTKLIDQFPANSLHNFYVQVSRQLNAPYFLEPPSLSKNSPYVYPYVCTYTLKWPERLNVTDVGFTVQKAKENAARNAISLLKSCSRMDKSGRPIFGNGSKPILNQLQNFTQPIRSYSTLENGEHDVKLFPSPRANSVKHNLKSKLETLVSENQEIENAASIFLHPKGVLHNCMVTVSTELKQDLKPSHQSKMSTLKGGVMRWTSTCTLKWPESIHFTGTSPRKQDSMDKAALAALSWLLKNDKIGTDGKPNIYSKNEISSIAIRNTHVLSINYEIENNLREIIKLYKNEMKDIIENELDESRNTEQIDLGCLDNEWPELENTIKDQPFRGLKFYRSKEPIKLPISDYKEAIIEKTKDSQVVIIKGEPGCGKSTRVPQYVMEGWARDFDQSRDAFRMVITQPRRIAAISLAERVANERSEQVGTTVGFQVRLNSNFSKRTGRILYCTTGILLRRLQSDPKLVDCTHVILDEAHERDVNTDLLMNLMKNSLKLNPKLKLLVMSATIDTQIFQEYFEGAPVLHIPGFTYPVEEHYLDVNNNQANLEKTLRMCSSSYPTIVHEDVAKSVNYIHRYKPDGAILVFLSGWDDIVKVKEMLENKSDLEVLCLHSRLQVSEQKRIFGRPSSGKRKVILSTNIAETSVTIDDVVYVIDTGIHKEERIDKKGIITVDNHWISKASATQRKGRAGRCRPGECYRLYTKNKFSHMDSYSIPEILRTSLTKIILDSKVYSNNINAVEFLQNLICAPDLKAIKRAVAELIDLEMLDKNENLTPLGRTASEFQMEPQLSKAMINAVIYQCTTPIVDIATIFSSETAIFTSDLTDKEGMKKIKANYHNDSDHLALMVLFEEFLNCTENGNFNAAREMCRETGLVYNKMSVLEKLRLIHFEYLRKGLKDAIPIISDEFSDNNELVKAVLLSGVGNVLQYRNWVIKKGRLKKANVLITKYEENATITRESVNSKRATFWSNFLVHINQTLSNLRHTTIIRETSVVSPLVVALFKNGSLVIEEISKENVSTKIKSSDQVMLKINGTNIVFVCDRLQAQVLQSCKDVLTRCNKYYVRQLTVTGQSDPAIDEAWAEILSVLNNILSPSQVSSKRPR